MVCAPSSFPTPPCSPPSEDGQKPTEHFRFLDLPAEIRTRVYRTVLYDAPVGEKDESSSVFQICKQICAELEGFLHDEKTVTITAAFHSFLHHPRFGPAQVYCHTTVTSKDVEHMQFGPSSVTTFSTIWPQRMLTVENINLNIYLSDEKPRSYKHRSDFFSVNHLLGSLNTFLQQSKRADQKLRINFFSSNAPVSQLLAPEIIYPISKFSFDLDLDLSGLDDELEQKVIDKRFSPGAYVQRDAIGEWREWRPKVKKLLHQNEDAKPGIDVAATTAAARAFQNFDHHVEHRNFQIDEETDRMLLQILDKVKSCAGYAG